MAQGDYPPEKNIQDRLVAAERAWGEEAQELTNQYNEKVEELREYMNEVGQNKTRDTQFKVDAMRRDMAELQAASARASRRAQAAGQGEYLFQEAAHRDPRYTHKWGSLYAACQKAGLVRKDRDDVDNEAVAASKPGRTRTDPVKTLGER